MRTFRRGGRYEVVKFSEREMVERIEALLASKNGEDKIGNKIAKWCVKCDDLIRGRGKNGDNDYIEIAKIYEYAYAAVISQGE